jgi:integrase
MRVWLSQEERQQLLDVHSEYPQRLAALRLGLHGLRSVEIMGVAKGHFREIDGTEDVYKLRVPEENAKATKAQGSNARETPISFRLYHDAQTYANSIDKNKWEPLMEVGKRQVRRWIEDAREELREETGNENWKYLSLHDLRRTWATDTFYSLSFAGVPVAEELTMSWGGWAKSETGRGVFRQNYLGPVPDHITVQASEHLAYI